jgi:putative ubiquitin-RnfH superfamily antitoxin RatB of RatAB toxin-antitoxin module
LVNRVRIVREVAAAVRGAIGPNRVLGVRLCGDEGIPGGASVAEAVETARLLDRDGAIDYVNTSVGVATATLHLVEPPMGVPAGYAQTVPAAIRAAVSLPVIGVGRFTDPAQAQRAIRAGECDLVGVVRGQIADPDFAARARASRRVRSCTGCNQECAGRVGLNMRLGCVVNPRAGREGVPLAAPVRPGRRVLVVGGGPAGLRAAATAAGRGHRVVLCERLDRTGGQVADAASAPGRDEFGVLADDLLDETTCWTSACGSVSTCGRAARSTWPRFSARNPTSSCSRRVPGRRFPAGPPGSTGSSTCVTSSAAAPTRPVWCWCTTSWASTRAHRWPSCWPRRAASWRS